MSIPDNGLIAVLLLMLLGSSIILGAFLAYLINHWIQSRVGDTGSKFRFSGRGARRAATVVSEPSYLERPSRWLAIKTSNLQKVQSMLGMLNASPCQVADALSQLGDRRMFISPPVAGWILVFGQSLPDPVEDADDCFHFILRVSREFGSVQFYSSNRALSHYAWVRAENGQIYRAYSWANETLWNQGEITGVERELKLRTFDYFDAYPGMMEGGRDLHANQTEKVFSIAARWSIDPMVLTTGAHTSQLGLVGDLNTIRIR